MATNIKTQHLHFNTSDSEEKLSNLSSDSEEKSSNSEEKLSNSSNSEEKSSNSEEKSSNSGEKSSNSEEKSNDKSTNSSSTTNHIQFDSDSGESIVPSDINNSVPTTTNSEEREELVLANPCKSNLEKEYTSLNCSSENMYSNNCNNFLLKKELIENECSKEHLDNDKFLYPSLNDINFNIKIANKKEFNDTKYDGTIYKNIKEQADIIAKAEFELSPHQTFVKNFLSFQTPYNSLLLFHGLGTGKTCSAIGVCEEMRDYMIQTGTKKKIIIVASENVQDNFKLQLFDERKLNSVDGIWTVKGCVGNKLLKEINPMNMKGLTKENIISQVKSLINSNYSFLGYGQFANYIIKILTHEKSANNAKNNPNKKLLNNLLIRRIQREFNERLIVIDEIHNIRKSEDNENKKLALYLELLVKASQNIRLLFLSATPMYNSYKEIVWLLNIMNINDKRGRIETKDIFDKDGNFKDKGKELLIRKATGYISFVRGENPYTFPYRVYPNEFAKQHTFPFIKYPTHQMNMKKIKDSNKNRILSLFLLKIGNCGNCGQCQMCAYKYIIFHLRNKTFQVTTKIGTVREMPSFSNMESFGYTLLQIPIESLIISYPHDELKNAIKQIPKNKYLNEVETNFQENDEPEESAIKINILDEPELEKSVLESNKSNESDESDESNDSDSNISVTAVQLRIDPRELTGKKGLMRMMTFTDSKAPPMKGNYKYKESTLTKYGPIFKKENIGKYSTKIENIINSIIIQTNDEIKVADGVIMVFSQYIDSGLIPLALALEEAGFSRFGENTHNLFDTPPNSVDVRTMKPSTNNRDFIPARYAMITGDSRLSPNNEFEVKGLTSENNINGEKIKVVLISRAGSEGIDFKFIRQVHILDPWYNMNRMEQVIGRAVRNLSHKDLPFEKRNVQIFMYGTILEDADKEEAADMYVYRVAEYKAIQIGKVTRLLKESAVDCIINHDQTNFTREIMSASLDEPITQELSTGIVLKDFKIGDAPFSPACDYMANCNYTCRPSEKLDKANLNEDTYNEYFIKINSDKIIQKVRLLMKERFFYTKKTLISLIQIPKPYPYIQIYSALTSLIEDNTEFIEDKFGRSGRLINIGEYYLFQPIELKDKNISIYDRSVPIDYKHEMIKFKLNKNVLHPVVDNRNLLNLSVKDNIESLDKSSLNERNSLDKTTLKPIVFKEMQKIFDDIKNMVIDVNFKKTKGDDEWHYHCGIAIKKILNKSVLDYDIFLGMNEQMLYRFLVAHMIEKLLFKEKVSLINYIYSLTDRIESEESFEHLIKLYFQENSYLVDRKHFVLFYDYDKMKVMNFNSKERKWEVSKASNEDRFTESEEVQEQISFNEKQYNETIGFIGYQKNQNYLTFKTKNILSKRDTGARCDEKGKGKSIELFNIIVNSEIFTKENTKQIVSQELCVYEEFVLRYFNEIKRNKKKWFLTPEMAIHNKLYTVTKKDI